MVKNQTLWIIIFLAPTLILFFMVFAVPLVTVIGTSFTRWITVEPMRFAGLKNFIYLFTESEKFRIALKNTFLWMAIAGTLHVAIGLVLSLVLITKPFGWRTMRMMFFMPNLIPGVSLATIFLLLLSPEIGVVNSVIRSLGFSEFYHNWFSDLDTAFLSVTMIWLFYTGFLIILIMAEFESIPKSLFEAAKIDGARPLQVNWYITIPLLRNILGTCVLLALVSQITQFGHVWIATRGGPGYATQNLALMLYQTFQSNNYGVANAVGTIQIVIGIGTVIIINRVFRMGRSHLSK